MNVSYCSNKRPLIYRHASKKPKRVKSSHSYFDETSDETQVYQLCNEDRTHFPFLMIDENKDRLPPAEFVSKFYIVMTSTKVISIINLKLP